MNKPTPYFFKKKNLKGIFPHNTCTLIFKTAKYGKAEGNNGHASLSLSITPFMPQKRPLTVDDQVLRVVSARVLLLQFPDPFASDSVWRLLCVVDVGLVSPNRLLSFFRHTHVAVVKSRSLTEYSLF